MSKEIGQDEFDVEVLERSHEVPVLVDFWAPWCGPCRMLGPVLEQIAAKREGELELVKINTDESPSLSRKLRIQGIPAVKLYAGGKVVGEFVGALPGATIERFLDEHLPSEADEKVEAGQRHLKGEDREAARRAFEAALALEGDHPAARLALASLAFADGDAAAVREHANAIHPSTDEYEAGQTLVEALVFHERCEAAGGLEAARARVEADAEDLDGWYALGCCHAVAEQWTEALDAFLESVMRKPKHDGAAAHRAILLVFRLLGHDHELVDPTQRKLQIYT